MTARVVMPVGARFGEWTVVRDLRPAQPYMLLVRCSCGAECVRTAQSIRIGQSTRCVKCRRSHGETKSGERKPFEYRVWSGIKSRCYSAAAPSFANYGGRGIVMSDAWRSDFAAFLRDMGRAPSPKHSVDRIDNDGPYSAENCRWATAAEQARNKRSNRRIAADGEVLCITDWTARLGGSENLIRQRLAAGWSTEAAVLTPVGARSRRSPRDLGGGR